MSQLVTRTGLPVAFGGYESTGTIVVSSVVGNRTQHLTGLGVQAARGLGGKAFVERRPRLTLDYKTSKYITHDYDRAVLGEGISTLFAVPVLVAGVPRGVLYCGSWTSASLGENTAREAMQVASELAVELRVRDEVRRHLAAFPTPSPTGVDASAKERLRAEFAEIRAISAAVDDPALRDRLSALERRLAGLAGDAPVEQTDIRLSPRETDVLACAALGATNAEIGASLSLKEATVKSYLQSAMAKLDASTRHAAVAKARRLGILP
ncbi:DNA-binding protein [Microbacterium sp. No. 7]|nr:DNA-binding protein [Microbacterium sp. No. 7]